MVRLRVLYPSIGFTIDFLSQSLFCEAFLFEPSLGESIWFVIPEVFSLNNKVMFKSRKVFVALDWEMSNEAVFEVSNECVFDMSNEAVFDMSNEAVFDMSNEAVFDF